MAALKQQFTDLWQRVTPDFNDPANYYGDDPPGEANLSIAANWVGEAFSCLSLTLEMCVPPSLGGAL